MRPDTESSHSKFKYKLDHEGEVNLLGKTPLDQGGLNSQTLSDVTYYHVWELQQEVHAYFT